MKTFRWNIGIIIIRIGYIVRKYQCKPEIFSFRWNIGRIILKWGYALRGQTPMKTWEKNKKNK